MRILGFGAHPDDAEIFFAGLLAVYRAAGNDIGWAIATDGAKGGVGDPAALAARRRDEAVAGATLFGVTPIFLDRADGELAEDREAAGPVSAAIEAQAPDLIVTHPPNDYHPDHRALSRLVVDAARFNIPVLYADTLLGVGSNPTIYVDISEHFDRKRAAIMAHVSQHPERLAEAAETWNRFRALQTGLDGARYAEAYSFEARFPFADIHGLLPPGPTVQAFQAR